MEEHIVRDPLRPLPTSIIIGYTDCALNQLFFLTVNEVKDEMKWMSEDMNPEKGPAISTLLTTIVSLATLRLECGTPIGI